MIDGVTYGSREDIAKIAVEFGTFSLDEYEKYAKNRNTMAAIWLRDVATLDCPLSLHELRAAWPGFHPPQLYRYRSREEIEALERLAGVRFWA